MRTHQFSVLLLFWGCLCWRNKSYKDATLKTKQMLQLPGVLFFSRTQEALLVHFKTRQTSCLISQYLGIPLSCFWRSTLYLYFFQPVLGNWNNSNTVVTIFNVLIQSLLKSWLTERFPFTANGTWIWPDVTWKVKQLIFFLVLSSYLKFDFATENPV